MKKPLIFLLCIALVLGLGGCRDTKQYDYEGSSDKQFQFKTFLGIPSKLRVYNANETSFYVKELTQEEFENYYKEMAEAGFTMASAPTEIEGETHNLRMLDAAKKFGLKQMLGEMIDESGISLSLMLRGETSDPSGKPYANYTDAEIVAKTKQFLAPYMEHEAFYGVAIWDEPGLHKFDYLARAERLFMEAAPGKLFYTNLLPITASLSSLGVPDNEHRIDYINGYLEKIKSDYISYDYYPLFEGTDGNMAVGEEFLYNLQMYRTAATASERELWTYLLSTDHTFGTRRYMPITSAAQIAWQTYTVMAFGCNSITWFTYFPPPPVDSDGTQFGTGLYDRKGRKTEVYSYVKSVQNKVKGFENVYFNFEWESIITAVGEENEYGYVDSFDYMDEGFAKKTHPKIKSYTFQQDGLIGTFKDADGKNGFMVVNYANPAQNLTNNVSISFNGSSGAAVYRNGKKQLVSLDNGVLNLTLEPGEGIFVIPA